jgi:divalent metal cation (Fe/Co/Zn/Cd) transporter
LIADSHPTLIDVAVSLGVVVSLVLVKPGLARADRVVAVLRRWCS